MMKRLRALFTRKPVQVFNITIQNPPAEMAADSVRAAVRRHGLGQP